MSSTSGAPSPPSRPAIPLIVATSSAAAASQRTKLTDLPPPAAVLAFPKLLRLLSPPSAAGAREQLHAARLRRSRRHGPLLGSVAKSLKIASEHGDS
ncbi:hypothetical protein E4U41_003498 [Claviceps citrina]|nr:hypothetical protein E4U41_003498 [Claviceps citrina]